MPQQDYASRAIQTRLALNGQILNPPDFLKEGFIMENSTAQTAPDPFNLANLVINQNYLETAGSTKLLTSVRVGKPHRQEWVRVNPDPAYRDIFGIFESKEDRTVYLVTPTMVETLIGEIYFATLYSGVTKTGVAFLWPVRLPGNDGRQNEWHRTAALAAEEAMTRWVRVVANMSAGAYDIYYATSDQGEAKWPDKPFQELLRIAFRNEGIIDSDEHPVVRKLHGFA
jgi:hypothetical protein